MTEKLSKDFVRDRVIEWLKKKGYDKDLKVKWEGVGPDVWAVNDLSEEFFVETSGETNPVDRTVYFLEALGRIITRMMPEAAARYAIALPKSYSELAQSGISWEVSKKLNLEILLVDENGEVEEKTWADIKNLGTCHPNDCLFGRPARSCPPEPAVRQCSLVNVWILAKNSGDSKPLPTTRTVPLS